MDGKITFAENGQDPNSTVNNTFWAYHQPKEIVRVITGSFFRNMLIFKTVHIQGCNSF